VIAEAVSPDELLELEALTWEEERRGLMPPDFGGWLLRRMPKTVETRSPARWDAPHFRVMQETLDRVTAGELHRVIFQVPIRHGKTEHNTYGFLGYHFDRDPSFRALLASYNQTQANKFSRLARRFVRGLGVEMSPERDAASEWETRASGGVRAVGAGSGVASVNADGIFIDDPIGSREDAESPAKREQVWDWITNDILARTEPHTWVVLTMSRWHDDDPVGRLLDRQAGRWHVVDLPGVAEADDPLGRAEGEPLWPEQRDREWLDTKLVEMGSYGFASLIQGRPRPREGGRFKWEWWICLDDTPACGRVIRYWDLAGTAERAGADPDFSAGTLVGRMPDDRTAILHQAAFRKSVAERDAMLEVVARADRAKYGQNVEWWFERESGIGGADRMEAVVRRIQAVGLKCSTEPATGSKELRAEPLESAAEAGNVCLAPDDPASPWRDAFRLEASTFPGGKHDDRVDSASGAYNKLALTPSRKGRTFAWRV
jgi:predicted phage terminase large subunit-like protein